MSPDGEYNQLNLATLYNPETNMYLIDEMNLQIVGSTRDIINKKAYVPIANNAVLFGNPKYDLDAEQYNNQLSAFHEEHAHQEEPELTTMLDESDYASKVERSMIDSLSRSGISKLPGTEKEVKNISKMLSNNNWHTRIYTGNTALEEVVKAQKSPRILHIATHGVFLKDVEKEESHFGMETKKLVENPLLKSMLIFAGAENTLNKTVPNNSETDDGLLTAYETMNLNLDNTELVVLSACETGLGDVQNGEGVYGLQRAFYVAGARTLIMSLWTVNDQTTQELMTTFYEEWLSGKTKREAFIEAQQKLKKIYKYPYYWGAFVMVGE